MQAARALIALSVPVVVGATASPIGKVLSMVSDLQSKIISEGEVVQKEYAEFAEWCEDRSRNLGFEIKTGKSEVESLNAAIAEEKATTGSLTTKVEELAGALATNDADLKAATEIRNKEGTDFAAEEKELVETISMLSRATSILEREMKGGASMMQLKNVGNLAQTFNVMVQASLIGTGDAAKLTAFVQDTQKGQESDDDEAPGAPAATVYASQSGGIVDTLQDLTEKAESQLAETRKKETAALNNYEMLKQSLEDEIKFAQKDMDDAKKGIAESSEKKSTAEGDLEVTSKELSEDVKGKSTLHQDCMSKATSFESETKSRGEELKALATAKKIIQEATGGAALNQVSFMQLASALKSGKDLHKYEAVRLIRDLARKEHSGALVQLAGQMSAAMRSGDAFEKVKGLISDMISKLEKEAGADATKKAYCDKELAETNVKKSDKTDEIEKLSTKVEQMAAKSSQLKEEVAELESQLAKLGKAQAQMDKLRQEENAAYVESRAELEKGLTGIKTALKVLNEYYAKDDKSHSSADGASSGIVGLLEVIEADFSKNLAQVISDEEAAVAEFEQVSKENEIEKTTKDQDVKYKTKESKELDKTAAELTSDRTGVQAELDAVLEYLSKIEEECIAKAETYEARKERRTAEIAGLKEAFEILESETALVQRKASHKTLRGAVMRAN
jgi:hypothetical protein